MKYRHEIDGLRAVAVIPVLLFHSGYQAFSGGFVGVDVFFVISGYLITQILINELSLNNFSLAKFYTRRANRILPALFFMLIITTFLAIVFLAPSAFKDYSLSLINVNTFTSNFYFYSESGYFARDAIEMPLLHTWTLAVEEQFYLFFPLLLAALWARGKGPVITALLSLSGLSFLVSVLLLKSNHEYANFYLIVSRAWELFLGAVGAIAWNKNYTHQLSRWVKELASWLGLLLILVACFTFSKSTPFPGWYTLLPVFGSLLILLCAESKSSISYLLSNPVMVFLGLISYSLYLWHHPILSFIHIQSTGVPAQYALAFGLAMSLVMATISWQWVEKPFRTIHRKQHNHWKIFVPVMAGLMVVGAWGYLSAGAPQRYGGQAFSQSMTKNPLKEECHAKESKNISPTKACRYFVENVTWAVLGDSHMAEPAYALAEKLKPMNQGIVHLTFGNCPPAFGLPLASPIGCRQWTEAAIEMIVEDQKITNVLIGYRYSKYLFGRNKPSFPDLPNGSPLSLFEAKSKYDTHDTAREAIWEGFSSIINTLLQSGKKVYIVYPIPELPEDIESLIYPANVFAEMTLTPSQQSITSAYYNRRNEYILSKLATLNFDQNLTAIKPIELFCNNQYCPGVLHGEALYFDSNHLSLAGSKVLLSSLQIKQ